MDSIRFLIVQVNIEYGDNEMKGSHTESMKRLILDGKIVGYQKTDKYEDKGNCLANYQRKVDEPEDAWLDSDWIIYDSFDIGIKVGDEWWFGNDIVKWKDSQGNTGKCKISVNNILHMNLSSRYSFYPTKRIGSIYDSEETS